MQGLNAFLNMRLRLIFLKSTLDTLKVSNYLKTCPASFPRALSASFLLSTLNSFQRVLRITSCNGTWFNPYRGRCQVPIFIWQPPKVRFISQGKKTTETILVTPLVGEERCEEGYCLQEDLVSCWQLVVHTEALHRSTGCWRVTGRWCFLSLWCSPGCRKC